MGCHFPSRLKLIGSKDLTFRAKQLHQMVYVLAHKGVIGRILYNREATIRFNKAEVKSTRSLLINSCCASGQVNE